MKKGKRKKAEKRLNWTDLHFVKKDILSIRSSLGAARYALVTNFNPFEAKEQLENAQRAVGRLIQKFFREGELGPQA